MEKENLQDWIVFTTEGTEVVLTINTPYKSSLDNHEYLTLMKFNFMRVQTDGSYLFFNENNLNSIYGTHCLLTDMMFRYVKLQNVAERENVNPLTMYADLFSAMLECLREDFKNVNIEFNKDSLTYLFLLHYFQSSGHLTFTPFETLIQLVSEYEDFLLMAKALNYQICAANNYDFPSEDFIRETQGLPLDWIVSILKKETQ